VYDTLAAVYRYLVPRGLSVPEGLGPGSRVLDCACGTGELAVALAERGCDVRASDASPGMVERARALAGERGVQVTFEVRRWEELEPTGDRDTTFCVGNSLVHAADRRRALAGMAGTLAPGGILWVTSRNWETLDPRLTVELVDGAVVVRAWALDEHAMDVAVVVGDEIFRERLTVFPFTHRELVEDLRAVGLTAIEDGWSAGAERYLVTARRAA
jgi:2-polyprenyl-3-methyl-5-hydroxy-6-metoxy-1,4-benzoquinol methylase